MAYILNASDCEYLSRVVSKNPNNIRKLSGYELQALMNFCEEIKMKKIEAVDSLWRIGKPCIISLDKWNVMQQRIRIEFNRRQLPSVSAARSREEGKRMMRNEWGKSNFSRFNIVEND